MLGVGKLLKVRGEGIRGKGGKEGTGDPEGLPLWGKEGKKGTPHTLYLTPLKAV